jgi:hypothetical protein
MNLKKNLKYKKKYSNLTLKYYGHNNFNQTGGTNNIDFKKKYKELKMIIQKGGGCAFISEDNIDKINFFKDRNIFNDTEDYFNPIWGMILQNSSYLTNMFFLDKLKIISDTPTPNINIKKIITSVDTTIIPTVSLIGNDDNKKINSYEYGKYIALKYINMKNKFIGQKKDGGYFLMLDGAVKGMFPYNIKKDYQTEILGIINNFKKFNFTEHNKIIDFRIIIYCMWWSSNNYNGIIEYYKGIKTIFDMIKECLPNNSDLRNILKICSDKISNNLSIKIFENGDYDENKNDDGINEYKDGYGDENINVLSFEKIIYNITQSIHIYKTEKSQNFDSIKPFKYSDCGETVMRNFINIICYAGNNIFNIDLIKSKFNLNEKLIEFYEKFDTIEKQSSNSHEEYIYDQKLNCRDAWSYLIIKYANNNIKFNEFYKNEDDYEYGFDMTSGLSKDGQKINFLQLMNNLLGDEIQNFNEVSTETVKINSKIDNKGIGNIILTYKNNDEYKISLIDGHYDTYYKNNSNIGNIDHLNFEQQKYIQILSNDYSIITLENYVWYNLNIENIIHLLFHTSFDLNKKLFEFTLTDLFYPFDRIRIDVPVIENISESDPGYYNILKKNLEKINNDIVNQYMYIATDFNFCKTLKLKNLNCIIDNLDKEHLSISSEITEIGELEKECLNELESIEYLRTFKICTLNLSNMENLLAIKHISGDNIQEINLSNSINIKSLGDNFLLNCPNLKIINLENLKNLESIGDNFLADCISLKIINLNNLNNLITIGNKFLYNCENLNHIDISMNSLKHIGDNFLSNCFNLTTIRLNNLNNLITIGDNFLLNCDKLSYIDFSNLTNLQSIGKNCFYDCFSLNTILLPKLNNLKFGENFIFGCKNLKTITFL